MLTKTQLLVFYEICNGNNRLNKITSILKMNKTHLSEVISILIREKLIVKQNNSLSVSSFPFALKLKRLFTNKNLIDILHNSGINILISFLDNKTIKDVAIENNLKEVTIRKFIQKAQERSILLKEDKKYIVNYKVWQDLVSFLKEYKSFQENYDYRAPINSTIYYKNKKEIIFSTNQKTNAVLTSFSVFNNYQINLYNLEYFYYYPFKKLSKKDILLHTLKIIEKTKEYRQILYLALFYYKYRVDFKKIEHDILFNLNKIFLGSKIEGYPSLKEIKEKLKVYNINFK